MILTAAPVLRAFLSRGKRQDDLLGHPLVTSTGACQKPQTAGTRPPGEGKHSRISEATATKNVVPA
jgi:hypothetical protein